MIASELIKELEKMIETNGDLPVGIVSTDMYCGEIVTVDAYGQMDGALFVPDTICVIGEY